MGGIAGWVMSDREYLGLRMMKRPRYQDQTKLGNAAVTSRYGAEGSLRSLSGLAACRMRPGSLAQLGGGSPGP